MAANLPAQRPCDSPQNPCVAVAATPRTHILALDGLRGIAVLAVLVVHYSRTLPVDGTVSRALRSLSSYGWSGVDLFFVLSGFLIGGILFDTRTRSGWWWNFTVRRSLRILPLYYLALLGYCIYWYFSAVFWPSAGGGSYGDALTSSAVFLQNFHFVAMGDTFSGFDSLIFHFWSLAVEQQFYLLLPVVMLVRGTGTVRWVISSLVVIAILYRAWLVRDGVPDRAAYILLPARMDALLLGCLVAWELRFAKGHPSARQLAGLMAAVFAVTVVVILWSGTTNPFTVPMQIAGCSLNAVLFALVIYFVSLPQIAEGWLHRLLKLKILADLGKVSYGVYITHMLFLHFGYEVVMEGRPAANLGTAALAIGAMFAVTLIVASLSYRFFETPFLKLKARI